MWEKNEKNAEPQKPPRHFLVHATAVRPQVNEEMETLTTSLFFSLQALQHPEFFGGENMQLVQPDLFLGLFFFLQSIFFSFVQIWRLDLALQDRKFSR